MKRMITCWAQPLGIGMMILLLAGCNYPANIDATPTVAFDDVLSLDGYPLITLEQVGNIPAGTHVKVRGILAGDGRRLYRIVAQDETTAEAREDQLEMAPGVTPIPTPTIAFIDALGRGGYPLITLEQVGSIPAGTRVMTGGVWFDGINTVYQIVTPDGLTAEAREYQLTLAPGVTLGPTPTAAFGGVLASSWYGLVTLEQVGSIPSGTRVRIGSLWFDGTFTMYQITAQDGSTAEAREDQLTFAPGFTPGPTPTAQFSDCMGYVLMTTEQVGSIPAGTRVRAGSLWFDGTYTMYQISAQDGSTAEAREDQLALAPDVTPGPTPTAAFDGVLATGWYGLITLEQVGNIPEGTRVRVWGIGFDGIHTIYQIAAQDGSTADAREDQLAFAPGFTPAPAPTAAFYDALGMGGYPLITLEQIGNIPADTRVNAGISWFDGTQTMYQITAQDGSTAEARENQLTYVPGVTPAPTPIAQFGSYIGMGFLLMTTEQVENIPAGMRVRISYASRDDIGWIYFIVAQDEVTSAEARDDQLTLAPYATPGPSPTFTPTPSPSPTALASLPILPDMPQGQPEMVWSVSEPQSQPAQLAARGGEWHFGYWVCLSREHGRWRDGTASQ